MKCAICNKEVDRLVKMEQCDCPDGIPATPSKDPAEFCEFANFSFSDSPSMLYHEEMTGFKNPFDRLNILNLGYIRVLNNMISDPNGDEDREFTNLLRGTMTQIARSFNKAPVDDSDMIALNFLLGFESIHYPEARLFSKMLNRYTRVSLQDVFDGVLGYETDIDVKFQLVYGPKGPAVMYRVSYHMNSFIQLHAYILLFKHLIQGMSVEYAKLFSYFIIAVEALIQDGETYRNHLGAARLTLEAIPIMTGLAQENKNRYMNEYKRYLFKT
ncbi:MAG: hypothetical protein Q8R36_00620 [bacterium]|nr:hypothetical protein [bacterium]